MTDPIWIGFFDVRPMPGADPLDGAPGAYVYVAVQARDGAQFEERVRLAAAEQRVTVVDIEDVSPALARGVRALSGHHRRLISHARETNDVAWGTFHAYENDDE